MFNKYFLYDEFYLWSISLRLCPYRRKCSEAPIYGSKITDWDENGEEFSIWYLTFGEEVAEETPEEVLTVTELLQQRPILSDFLHLEADFCFIIEADGSYDVFKDS